MLTVACVLWVGDFKGRDYHLEHVGRLRSQVVEHLRQEHRFVCLTNLPAPDFQNYGIEGIQIKRLRNRMDGWWNKIELFTPGQFTERVLYLDLDVTIVGQLDDLADHPEPFIAIRDWQSDGLNSSVMAWDAGGYDTIRTDFDYPKDTLRFRGDQNWIEHMLPDAATFPLLWCRSYKKSIQSRLSDNLPDDCRVVVFHGQPKPWHLAA